ncbi:MAG: polysaccharide export protein [Paramuribaculum sp.]|nr:polysaccharide export protein [Paramuribaculum sp.]
MTYFRTCFTLTALVTIMLTGCKTKHDLSYLTDLENPAQGILTTINHTNTIEPENDLIITVKSEVETASAQFNLPYINPATPGTTTASSTHQLQTYKVYPDGDIIFPVLGKIHVAGMTTNELREYLTTRIREYVKEPIVTVTLVGYRIAVIGEVNNPHVFYTSAERYSILDALAACGGMSAYGRRDNVLIMRRTADNQIEYGHLDLHSSDITKSPYFWLKNNDIVIVDPNSIKQSNSKIDQNHSYRLSVISTVLGIVSVVTSVIIATVKK